MKKLTALLCAFSLSLWLVGCAQESTTEPAPAPSTGAPESGAPAAHEEGGATTPEGGTTPTEPAPGGEAGSTTEGAAGTTPTP